MTNHPKWLAPFEAGERLLHKAIGRFDAAAKRDASSDLVLSYVSDIENRIAEVIGLAAQAKALSMPTPDDDPDEPVDAVPAEPKDDPPVSAPAPWESNPLYIPPNLVAPPEEAELEAVSEHSSLAAAITAALNRGKRGVLVDRPGPHRRLSIGCGNPNHATTIKGPVSDFHLVVPPHSAATYRGFTLGDQFNGIESLYFHGGAFQNDGDDSFTPLLVHQHHTIGLVAAFGCAFADGIAGYPPYGQKWTASGTGACSPWFDNCVFTAGHEHMLYFQNVLPHPALECSNGVKRAMVVNQCRPTGTNSPRRTNYQLVNRLGDFPQGSAEIKPGTSRWVGCGAVLYRQTDALACVEQPGTPTLEGGRDFTIAGHLGPVCIVECSSIATRKSQGALVAWTESVQGKPRAFTKSDVSDGPQYSIDELHIVECDFDHIDNKHDLVEVSGVRKVVLDGGRWRGNLQRAVFKQNTKPYGGPFDNIDVEIRNAPDGI